MLQIGKNEGVDGMQMRDLRVLFAGKFCYASLLFTVQISRLSCPLMEGIAVKSDSSVLLSMLLGFWDIYIVSVPGI